MRIFEPHAHMISRITDDYEAMALAGVEAVLEPAFWASIAAAVPTPHALQPAMES